MKVGSSRSAEEFARTTTLLHTSLMNTPQKPVSLLPREHGAYAEMAFPQITALILGGGSLPAFLLATAVVCGFLLHEPALVVTGRRGPRAVKNAGDRARRRIGLLAAIAVVCGTIGLLLSPPAVWVATLVTVILGTLVVIVIAARIEMSVWGEMSVAVTFAAAAVPTALAGAVPAMQAMIQSGVWASVFILATITVNVIIDGHKTRTRRSGWFLVAASLLVGVTAAWVSRAGGQDRAVLAVLPVALACVLVILFRLTPRRLRWLGWSMVASNTATLILLLLFLT